MRASIEVSCPASPPLHPELRRVQQLVYEPHGLALTDIVAERESADYAGHSLRIAGRASRFRVAKTTPTKAGHFVTLWLRSAEGPIRPFDTHDELEFVVISAHSPEGYGQFVFSAATLLEHGVLSRPGQEGKRAFRVYPPWVAVESAQAARTQRWQVQHFVALTAGNAADGALVRELYGLLA